MLLHECHTPLHAQSQIMPVRTLMDIRLLYASPSHVPMAADETLFCMVYIHMPRQVAGLPGPAQARCQHQTRPELAEAEQAAGNALHGLRFHPSRASAQRTLVFSALR